MDFTAKENRMMLYDALSKTPKEAQKSIQAGRLKGFTDINPMWRIKMLTKAFGACGFGWWYRVIDTHIEDGSDGEKKCFAQIELFVRTENEVSQPIIGFGGASFVSNEKSGKYTSDECYKMAITDAIGSACKMLGMSADIYFSADRTKYTAPQENT